MEYKDTRLPNEEELKTLKNGYIMAQSNSLNDLNEIYKKMLDEKEYLLSQNIANTHPKLIQNLEQCIANMSAILNATNKEKSEQKSNKNSFSGFRFKTASNDDLENNNTSENGNQNDAQLEQNGQSEPPKPNDENESIEGDTQPSEIPDENSDVGIISPNENSEQGDTKLNENANSPTSQQLNRQNRGRPFRQNSIAKIFSNFPLNFDKIKERQKEKISQQASSKINNGTPSTQEGLLSEKSLKVSQPNPNYPPCNTPNCEPPRPPFPEPFPPRPEHKGCDPHKKMVTKELDIIRLLLLYMALRPNCPYTYRLCTIAQEHLEILGEMLE